MNKYPLAILLLGMFIFGLVSGLAFSYIMMSASLERIVSNIRINNLEIGFNETYIMDRLNETISSQIIFNNQSKPTQENTQR